MPIGYIFHGVSILSGAAAEEPRHEAPVVQLPLELGVVVAAGAHLPEHPARSRPG